MSDSVTDIRPSPIAGKWYPGTPHHLAEVVDEMLDHAPDVALAGKVVGLVVPHAGYLYSGAIAARAFRLVRSGAFERVVVLSPLHQYHDAPLVTTAHHAYQTPLGVVPVDRGFLDALGQHVPLAAARFDQEHAVEIELPFLQRALEEGFSLVPLMLRDQSYSFTRQLGQALAQAIGPGGSTLLVASSDLSHFYTQSHAERLDRVVLDNLKSFDPQGLIRADEEGRGLACGRGAIASVLVAARLLGGDRVQIVGYSTSAAVTGDTQRVVGYGAAVITAPASGTGAPHNPPSH
jgi:AmmeMemoRadiSam system protein B